MPPLCNLSEVELTSTVITTVAHVKVTSTKIAMFPILHTERTEDILIF